MATHHITVTVPLGTARRIAELLAWFIQRSVGAEITSADKAKIRAYASLVAGPVYGNPLGDALDVYEEARKEKGL